MNWGIGRLPVCLPLARETKKIAGSRALPAIELKRHPAHRTAVGVSVDCRALRLSQGCADRLLLGVEIKGVMPHFTPPAGLLVAAKGQCRIEDVVAVDPDCARLQLPC